MKNRLLVAVPVLAALVLAPSSQASFTQELGSPVAVGTDPAGIVTADFDGDGRSDLAVANAGSGTISVLLRQAGGGFAPEGPALAAAPGTTSLAVADFNGDTRPDLAAANFQGPSSVGQVFLRNPIGGFAQEGANYPIPGAISVAAGDFNSDSQPDLAWGSFTTDSISVFLRDVGPGFTQEGSPYTTAGHKSALVSADFNGDGRADVAATNSTGPGTVTVLTRAPANTGFAVDSFAVGPQPLALTTGDFSADGRADLAVSSFLSSSVRPLLGQPSGTFTSGGDFPTGGGAYGVAAGDFNLDGAPDLAVANNTAATVSVLLRSGAGFVADESSPIPTGQTAPNGVVAADFNGDSRLDLATTNYGSASVTVLLNTTPPAAGPPPPEPPPPGSLPRLRSKVSFGHKTTADYTELTKLQVKPVEIGDRVQLKCKGPGCKLSKKSVKVKKDKKSLSLVGFLKGSKLRPGATLEVRVTRPDTIGLYTRIAIRAPKKPQLTTRCLQPGSKKPVACS